MASTQWPGNQQSTSTPEIRPKIDFDLPRAPQRFAAVIMRIRDPKTTALIFASGKMVCTGAKSEEKSRLAARKYCRILQKLDYDAQFKVALHSIIFNTNEIIASSFIILCGSVNILLV